MMMQKPKKLWSSYQENIFRDIREGQGHTVVIAVAGSGKTSTLVEGFKHIPKKVAGGKTKTLMVAFNKDIADELRERAPSYVDCMTLHSLGFKAIRNSFGKDVKFYEDKTQDIIKKILATQGYKGNDKNTFDTISSLKRTVSLCKGYLFDIPSKIDELMDRFDIDTGLLDRDIFIKNICQALRECKNIKTVVDYDDMVYFPFVFNLPVGKWDRVCIDECQDLNASQIHMALSACKKDGRILATGDPAQSLYAFRGADSNAVNNIIKRLDAKVLPLSISYRCAKNIVRLAQKLVPQIEYHLDAKEGEIVSISEDDFLYEVKAGDFVLSRINAPLIYHCLTLLKRGVRANIKGRDIGSSLSYMIKKSEAKTIPEFREWLDKWERSEIKRLQEKGRDPIISTDKAACLRAFLNDVKSLEEVKHNIKELFTDGEDHNMVIFSSIHRAKGDERERVFLLTKTLRRDMSQEEKNCEYVAITRSKSTLFLVK